VGVDGGSAGERGRKQGPGEAALGGAQGLQTEEQECQDGRRAQEGGEDPAFGQELQVVVLRVLDTEAAGRRLEAGQRVLVGAEAGADRGARGRDAQGGVETQPAGKSKASSRICSRSAPVWGLS